MPKPLYHRWLNLLRWLRRRHAVPRRRRNLDWLDDAGAGTLVDDDAPPRGCGWFDSSQDLREGLSVSEHASADAVAAQLPLAAWVDLQLSGWRPVLPA